MELINRDYIVGKIIDLYSDGDKVDERDKVINDVIDIIDNAPEIDTSDLISKSDLLRRIDEERKYLVSRGLTGAEHVITKAIRDLIDTDPEEV